MSEDGAWAEREKIIINEKSIHPYTPITNFKCDLNNKLEKYEAARIELQKEIETYNEAAKNIEILTGSLSDDNCAIAHYEVLREIKAWQQALEKATLKAKFYY